MSMRLLLQNFFVTLSETDQGNLSFSLIFELLRVFIKTLTTDHKYSLCYIWNLQVVDQMQLSKKRKTFSQFCSPFLNSSSTFECFDKKMTFTANVFLKLKTVRDVVRRNFGWPGFRALFDSEHVKASQTLTKYA